MKFFIYEKKHASLRLINNLIFNLFIITITSRSLKREKYSLNIEKLAFYDNDKKF